jgi:hypothetical protein
MPKKHDQATFDFQQGSRVDTPKGIAHLVAFHRHGLVRAFLCKRSSIFFSFSCFQRIYHFPQHLTRKKQRPARILDRIVRDATTEDRR